MFSRHGDFHIKSSLFREFPVAFEDVCVREGRACPNPCSLRRISCDESYITQHDLSISRPFSLP